MPPTTSGILYRFISAYDIERVEFNEISNDETSIYMFIPEVDPKVLEKDKYNAPNVIPHVVTTSPTNPVEKGGAEKFSKELSDLPENNEPNPFIHEYTKETYNDLIEMFKDQITSIYSPGLNMTLTVAMHYQLILIQLNQANVMHSLHIKHMKKERSNIPHLMALLVQQILFQVILIMNCYMEQVLTRLKIE